MTWSIVRGAMAFVGNLPVPPGQAVGVVVGLVLDRLSPAPLSGPRGLHRAVGAVTLAAGAALNAWALVERRRRTAGTFELEHPQWLVTSGPYATSRHPMYVGWWLLHLGVGVWRGSAWVAGTLPAAVLAEHPGVLDEERKLAREFGAEFTEYAERVPRYLRWWPRRSAAARPLRPTS